MKDYKECKNCWYLPFCHDNDYGNFDPDDPKCPNYEEGMKQFDKKS